MRRTFAPFVNLSVLVLHLYIVCCVAPFHLMCKMLPNEHIDLGFNDPLEDCCDYIDLDNRENELCNRKGLNLLQFNIRGILSKQDLLKTFLRDISKDCKLDIIMLVETWLTKSNSKRLKIPGYAFVGSHRKHKRGGGVGILIRQDLEFRERPDLSLNIPNFECMMVELKTHKDSIFLCTIYRPPNCSERDFLKSYKKQLNKLSSHQISRLIIGIYHNLDMIKQDKHKPTQEFIEMNLDHQLIPTITKPTRITRSTATLIDNIIVGIDFQTSMDPGILMSDISDHYPCLLTIHDEAIFKKQNKKVQTRKLDSSKIDIINKTLSMVDWDEELYNKDVDTQYNLFHTKLLGTLDEIAPYKTVTIPSDKIIRDPWLTPGLMKCFTKQRTLYKSSLRKQASLNEIDRYRSYRNKLKEVIRRAKEHYYRAKCQEFRQNTKRLWKLVNKLTHKTNDKTNIVEYLKLENQDIYEDQVIADEFAKHFSSVGTNYAKKIPLPQKNINTYLDQIPHNDHTIFMTPTSTMEIARVIQQLPNKHSSGYDNLSNTLLKQLSASIEIPLEIIFNNSIKSGKFPHEMKQAIVVPLYKAKDRANVNNYRPISLLATISKVLEKIVYARVYKFLTATEQIYSGQYGFRTGHSCQNAISELVGNIQKNMEENKSSIGVFIDLSKAFDTPNHKILLSKLEKYGVRGTTLEWFSSYLDSRTMRTKITSSKSQKVLSGNYDLEYGTPQGSCLGPLLFLIFINDLPLSLIHGSSLLFADDTTLLHSHRNFRYLKLTVEDDMLRLLDWFRANQLTLNLDKTVCLLFSNQKDPEVITINIGNSTLTSSDYVKFLGVWIDRHLNWNKHTSLLLMKLKQNTHLLSTCKKFLQKSTLKLIYYAHLYSHLTYGIVVWGNMVCRSTLNKIQKTIDNCFMLITGQKPSESGYSKEKMMTIFNLIDLENKKLGFQLDKGSLPSNLSKLLWTDSKNKPLHRTHNYNTRHSKLSNLPMATKSKYHHGFQVESIKAYHTLPLETRLIPTLPSFVSKLKREMYST